jgi:hypothetical protein
MEKNEKKGFKIRCPVNVIFQILVFIPSYMCANESHTSGNNNVHQTSRYDFNYQVVGTGNYDISLICT